jgi:hypothetical protein
MPGTDLALDENGDFIDADGDWLETSDLQPLARHQILDNRGLFFADPDAGSEIYLIPRKANFATMVRMEDAWRSALGVFIALGLAEDLVIETDEDQRGRFVTTGSITDRNAGTVDLTALLSFGLGEA